MENKVSSSNPNVKNVTVPTAKKPVDSQVPKIFPVKGPQNNKINISVPEEDSDVDEFDIDEAADEETQREGIGSNASDEPTQKLPKVTPIASAKKQDEPLSENADNKKKDAKPEKGEGDEIIDKIREDAEEHKDEAKKLDDKDEKQEGKEEGQKKPAKGKEKIRIVIRDAKPPIAARILQGLMRVICLFLIIAVCGIGIPRLFGINEFNVLTASMTPTYPTGSLVFVQPKEPATIRPGEVVTCIMNESLDMVTHRVMKNDYDDKTLTTKGDANLTEDTPTLYENVVGVVVFSLPYVGGVVDYLTNDTNGRVLGIGGVLCILALTFIAEAICFLLTKQAASVYNNPEEDEKSAGKKGKNKGKGKDKDKSTGKESVNVSTDDKDNNYEVTSINARQFNRQFRRGKGKPVETVPPRDQEDKQKKKHHKLHHKNNEPTEVEFDAPENKGKKSVEKVAGEAAKKAPSSNSASNDAPQEATEKTSEEPKRRGIV